MSRRYPLCRLVLMTFFATTFCFESVSFAQGGKLSAAQPHETNRHRFALLVGASDYVDPELNTLKAPPNDVELMKRLLIEVYGFSEDSTSQDREKHIKTLIGRQASRQAIVDAFRTQLIDKAKQHPNSTVVFYFSGHGSLVLDVDSSNPDRQHKTIVPSDSRTDGGFDIRDDEINDWFEELRGYTSDITFILDSCHSGTATKGVVSSIIAKEVLPDIRPQPPRVKPSINTGTKDVGNGFLTINDQYAAIYSSLRFESSYETDFPVKDDQTERYSFLTYWLAKTLSTYPHATYRQAVELISPVIGNAVYQHPQAEGNIGRPMFGVSGDSEDAFLKLSGPSQGKNLMIDGGRVLGLQEGAFLAIYKPDARKLVGDRDKLATARVTKVQDFTATAELSATPKIPIPGGAKVLLLTPFFGAQRLRVNLGANPSTTVLSKNDTRFLQTVTDKLTKSQLISLNPKDWNSLGAPGTTWDLGLQKGCVPHGNKPKPLPCEGTDPVVYFLVTPGQNTALFNFFVEPDDQNAPQKLLEAIEKRAKQENLRALVNAHSLLDKGHNSVTASLLLVSKQATPSGAVSDREEEPSASRQGTVRLRIGQHFKLKLENGSDQALNVVVISLGTSGSVRLLTPKGTGLTVPSKRSLTTTEWIVGPPTGLETYKIIAFTPPTENQVSPNFSVLEQSGLTPKDVHDTSPLSWLINQAAIGASKDPQPSLDYASWTTGRLDVIVEEGLK